jgi:serine/threonine protein kinase
LVELVSAHQLARDALDGLPVLLEQCPDVTALAGSNVMSLRGRSEGRQEPPHVPQESDDVAEGFPAASVPHGVGRPAKQWGVMLLLDAQLDSRYQPIARIGRGGMAEVMLTAMQSSGVTKLAVLKCLLPDLAEDPDFIEMFLDEARLCARLNHPNVVQTYEVLRHGDRLAIAMEYLDGQPLTSVLRRLGGELDVATRLLIITSVLAGLEYAHNLTDFDGTSLGVVHRDVTPHNVFVTYDGHVKLVDFGIAKTMAARNRTRPGSVRGKLAYLAPEALRGRVIDRRSDLFSVGVMLWEILAGRRLWVPKRADKVSWCLAPGASAPALPADLDIPAELRAVCVRALAIDPDARYQSAAELGAELEHLGALAGDSHARHLGQLVSRAFEPEIKARRVLLEVRLRGRLDEPSIVLARESPEKASPERPASAAPLVDERKTLESLAAPAPVLTPTGKRGHAWSRTVLVSATVAMIALMSGARLGGRSAAIAARRAKARALQAAPLVRTLEPPIESLPPREAVQPPSPRGANRERRSHLRRSHPLDPSSDDVLDIDGSPLPPSRGSGVWRDWNY